MALNLNDINADIDTILIDALPPTTTPAQKEATRLFFYKLAEVIQNHIKRGEVTITTTPQTVNIL